MIIHESSISIYNDIEKSDNHIFSNKIKIKICFDYLPKVTIEFGDFMREPYKVYMIEKSGRILHTDQISTGIYTLAFRRWIEDLDILVYDNKDALVKKFNLFDKIKSGKVLIAIESSSLGDTLAWIPYVNQFIETHNCSNATVTTFWNDLFEDQYPGFNLKYPGYRENDIDVLIGVGWYDEADPNKHKIDPRTVPLQKVASDILGVEYLGEIKPRIKSTGKRPTEKTKNVCIATESTAAAKHWNNPNGWQELINLLTQSGYVVNVIQKQPTHLLDVVDKTGDIDISERINDLINCDFFIGIGSGLSWLAWSLDVPVVLISGFSKPFCEFSDKTLRIIDESVCNGCFNNPQYFFDRGDWMWCPVHKDTDRHFECTKVITPYQVFRQINFWKNTL
jgi:autotransporter strand-loop-strand O-heptosyltransferase